MHLKKLENAFSHPERKKILPPTLVMMKDVVDPENNPHSWIAV